MIRRRAGSAARRARKIPATARLSDSVPPEVNSTSLGRAPSAAAMLSLDSSTRRRAARPELCRDEALPVWDIACGHGGDHLRQDRGGGGVVEIGHRCPG